MAVHDVTDQVDFNFPDGEFLPVTRCVCGHNYGSWDFTIGMDEDEPTKCHWCGRKLYFRHGIRVYEVE